MSDIHSPYGQKVIAGTDVPAVDGLSGAGDSLAFNRYATASGNREINASSKADLMAQIAGLGRKAREAGGLRTASDQKAVEMRSAQIKSAYASKDRHQFEVLGEVMSDEIWETMGRDGFTNKIFAIQNAAKGQVARVRVRKKDVQAFQLTSDGKVQANRIVQEWMYPAEFLIACQILINDKEIELSSADLLDEKFQDGLEAILVKDDRITKALLDRASTSFNDLVYYTSFNPTVFTTIRTQVNRWGSQAQNMLLAFDVWDDIISDPDFVNWWSPIEKHELVLEGSLGRLLNVDIHTDGLRYPTLQVLQPGEIYVTAAPVAVGAKVIYKELDSRAIDTYNLGVPARGWFLHTIQGQVVGNGRGVSAAKRLG